MGKPNPFYSWAAPAFREGDYVRFIDHRGSVREGDVMSIETHYSTHPAMSGARAYHIYSIQRRGFQRRVIVGEESVLTRLHDPNEDPGNG